jgi:hypothetical protein
MTMGIKMSSTNKERMRYCQNLGRFFLQVLLGCE